MYVCMYVYIDGCVIYIYIHIYINVADWPIWGSGNVTNWTKSNVANSMCFSTVFSKPCSDALPHSILQTPFIGHCLGALGGVKPSLANRVWRHSPAVFSRHHLLLDTHGNWTKMIVAYLNNILRVFWSCSYHFCVWGSADSYHPVLENIFFYISVSLLKSFPTPHGPPLAPNGVSPHPTSMLAKV